MLDRHLARQERYYCTRHFVPVELAVDAGVGSSSAIQRQLKATQYSLRCAAAAAAEPMHSHSLVAELVAVVVAAGAGAVGGSMGPACLGDRPYSTSGDGKQKNSSEVSEMKR